MALYVFMFIYAKEKATNHPFFFSGPLITNIKAHPQIRVREILKRTFLSYCLLNILPEQKYRKKNYEFNKLLIIRTQNVWELTPKQTKLQIIDIRIKQENYKTPMDNVAKDR